MELSGITLNFSVLDHSDFNGVQQRAIDNNNLQLLQQTFTRSIFYHILCCLHSLSHQIGAIDLMEQTESET